MKLKVRQPEISERDQIIKDLRAELADSRRAYEALMSRYARLEERLDELLVIAKQNQHKETKAKPTEPAPVLEGAEKIAFEDRPKPPEKPVKSKEKKKSRPTGRKKIPENLKAEKHTLRPEACACGCRELDVVDEVLETKLHVVSEHTRKREVERLTVRCRACGERTTARSLPPPDREFQNVAKLRLNMLCAGSTEGLDEHSKPHNFERAGIV